MKITPVLVALLIGLAGLSVGTVAAAPSAGDGTSKSLATQDRSTTIQPNASVDSFTLTDVSGTFTVEEFSVDRMETDRGAIENVSLEGIEISLDNTTVAVDEASTENGSLTNASVSVREGTVTIENGTAVVNGERVSVEDETLTVENGSVTSGVLSGTSIEDIGLDADEIKQLIEGASIDGMAMRDFSASEGITIDEVGIHGVEVGGHTGSAILGGVELSVFDNVTASVGNVNIEDGELIMQDATLVVEGAMVRVETGLVTTDGETAALDNEVVEIEGPITISRAEIQLPLP